jgi:HPt (histidine-containing phosphotransfer) domain-containing protein
MAALSKIKDVDAPPLAPSAPAIDLEHLRRMTLGERSLEREVLELFDRQSVMLLAWINEGNPAAIGTAAHTLKGSARGIGAWGVARAAEALERAAPEQQSGSIRALGSAIEQARAAIAELLRTP